MSNKNDANAIINQIALWTTFFIFLVLKLTGVIHWSWWFVTAPLWGGLAIVAVVFVIIVIAGLIMAGVDEVLSKRDKREREKAMRKV